MCTFRDTHTPTHRHTHIQTHTYIHTFPWKSINKRHFSLSVLRSVKAKQEILLPILAPKLRHRLWAQFGVLQLHSCPIVQSIRTEKKEGISSQTALRHAHYCFILCPHIQTSSLVIIILGPLNLITSSIPQNGSF